LHRQTDRQTDRQTLSSNRANLFLKKIRQTTTWFVRAAATGRHIRCHSPIIASLAILMLLTACGEGGVGGGTTLGTTITGSAGDGPITGAAISVTDGNGAVVTTTPATPFTDNTAHYNITIPSTTQLPVTITLKNGRDTVTGVTQDFNLTGVETAALSSGGTVILNINPFSTLAVASARAKGRLTAANLAAAITHVLNTVSFDLPTGFNPMTTTVDTTNVAAVIKANEAVAELIRRTGVSTAKTMANTITAIAEDITDGVLNGKVATGVTATQITAKTFGVILTKQAEISAAMLAGQLKITDKKGAIRVTAVNMKQKLNAAILVTQPTTTGAAADVSQVKVTQKFIDQAKKSVSMANLLTGGGNSTLNKLEAAIRTLSANTAPSTTQKANILAALNNANTALKTANTNANAGTNTTAVSTAATKTNAPPVFTGTPAISGTPIAGKRLTLINTAASDADGNKLTFTYQWKSNGAVIIGATATAYMVRTVDAGKKITAVITVNDGQLAANSTASFATASVNVLAGTTAPSNQNTVLAASITVAGGGSSVALVSSGTASNNVWLAPVGTKVFTAGTTMTKATSGTATSITAPATAGAYKLFVIDAVGNVSPASTATVTVDTTPPVLSSFTSTTAGGSYKAGASINITATYNEALASTSTLTVSLNSGKTGLVLNTVSGSTITGIYTVGANETSAALTVLSITSQNAKDIALNALITTTLPTTNIATASAIIIDTTAPAQTFSSLAFSADTGASTTDFITKTAVQTITATLSAALASGDIVSGSLDGGTTWTDITNKVTTTTLSWNAVTLPTAASNTLKLKMTDAAGNIGTGAIASQAYVLDTTAPTIQSKLPAVNATSVALTSGVNITFSEKMNTATITTTSFTTNKGATTIAGNISHNSGNIETFTPSGSLAAFTLYTVAVSNVITDVAGNALAPINWTFTTAANTVGGTVSGLTASESVKLALKVNLTTETLSITYPKTKFTFIAKLANAATYSVTVLTSPTGKVCIVSNGNGTISAAVNNVSVVCQLRTLNDTGITTWGNASVNNLTTTQTTFPGQDADNGRDAQAKASTLIKTGSSTNNTTQGFDFTKLDSAGVALVSQINTYATKPWDCVQDNHTGLMWEVKTTTASSLRNKNNVYTWYNSTGTNDGGNAGTVAATPACNTGGSCDTEKYVAAVNAAGLCGFSDWRMPKRESLRSIVDLSIASPGPTIDTGYFPNTINSWYWSASPYAGNATDAWFVVFVNGYDVANGKSSSFSVRLVRGGQ